MQSFGCNTGLQDMNKAMLQRFQYVRKLVQSTSTYTRDNPHALDRGGNMVDPLHKDAVSWSLIGAIRKSNTPKSATSEANAEMMRYFKSVNQISFISEWCDKVNHTQMLSAVDKCISKLEHDNESAKA